MRTGRSIEKTKPVNSTEEVSFSCCRPTLLLVTKERLWLFHALYRFPSRICHRSPQTEIEVAFSGAKNESNIPDSYFFEFDGNWPMQDSPIVSNENNYRKQSDVRKNRILALKMTKVWVDHTASRISFELSLSNRR